MQMPVVNIGHARSGYLNRESIRPFCHYDRVVGDVNYPNGVLPIGFLDELASESYFGPATAKAGWRAGLESREQARVTQPTQSEGSAGSQATGAD